MMLASDTTSHAPGFEYVIEKDIAVISFMRKCKYLLNIMHSQCNGVVSGYDLPLVPFRLTLKMKLHCLMPEKLVKSEKEALNKNDLQSIWASTQ